MVDFICDGLTQAVRNEGRELQIEKLWDSNLIPSTYE